MIGRLLSTSSQRWLVPALASAMLAGPVGGQAPAELRPGDRVRVQLGSESHPHVGLLVRLDDDSVVLAVGRPGDATLPVARTAVSQLWVSQGRSRSTGRGALIGLGVGFVAGAVLGAIAYQPCDSGASTGGDFSLGHGCMLDPGRGGTTLLAGAALGSVGLVAGGLIGFATKRDRWQAVDVARVIAAPAAGGGVTLGIRLGA